MQNSIPLTDEMQLQLAERFGGMDKWGPDRGPALWRRMGVGRERPFQVGEQVGSHLGGTRNPIVAVRWPAHTTDAGSCARTRPRDRRRARVLDVAGSPQPKTVDGIEQEPMHGTTFATTFTDANAPEFSGRGGCFETIRECTRTAGGSR